MDTYKCATIMEHKTEGELEDIQNMSLLLETVMKNGSLERKIHNSLNI